MSVMSGAPILWAAAGGCQTGLGGPPVIRRPRPARGGYPRRAMASISTRPPFGSAATPTVERAGGGSGMKRP